MSEKQPPPGSGETLPAFRFPEKKVDSSWKEEVKREREQAARGGIAGKSPEAAPASISKEPSPRKPSAPESAPAEEAPAGGAGKTSKLFVNFLAGLVQQALMQLGKMENPFTGQRELDLEGARYTIDLLATIQEKTKGNLTDQESRVLTESLRDLKFHYVDTANEVGRQMQEELKKSEPGAKRKG